MWMYVPVVEPVFDHIILYIRPVETWTNMHQAYDKTPLFIFVCVCLCVCVHALVNIFDCSSSCRSRKKKRRIHLRGSRRGDVQSVAAHTNIQTYAYIVLAVVSICLPFTLHHITVTTHNSLLLQKHPRLLTSSCVDWESEHCTRSATDMQFTSTDGGFSAVAD